MKQNLVVVFAVSLKNISIHSFAHLQETDETGGIRRCISQQGGHQISRLRHSLSIIIRAFHTPIELCPLSC